MCWKACTHKSGCFMCANFSARSPTFLSKVVHFDVLFRVRVALLLPFHTHLKQNWCLMYNSSMHVNRCKVIKWVYLVALFNQVNNMTRRVLSVEGHTINVLLSLHSFYFNLFLGKYHLPPLRFDLITLTSFHVSKLTVTSLIFEFQ